MTELKINLPKLRSYLKKMKREDCINYLDCLIKEIESIQNLQRFLINYISKMQSNNIKDYHMFKKQLDILVEIEVDMQKRLTWFYEILIPVPCENEQESYELK